MIKSHFGAISWGSFFVVKAQSFWPIWVLQYKVTGEQVTSLGMQNFIGSTGAVAVSELQICLGCSRKSKKCDKQMTFIVRIMHL
jgi:hypothetical protein